MGIRQIFIILVDISGYTRFIKMHKTSLLHAEKIVSELMEAVLAEVKTPVIAHEILGDAISLYALDEQVANQPDEIFAQLLDYFSAFWEREASLISACGICECDACEQVGKLKLKAILHAGEAAFTSVMNNKKISGEDVIIAHRLLKNSVPTDEYVLLTDAFVSRCSNLNLTGFTRCIEECEGIGPVVGYYQNLREPDELTSLVTSKKKWRDFFMIEGHMVKRWFAQGRYRFRNLPGY